MIASSVHSTRLMATCSTSSQLPSGVNGVPMSFAVDGKQYIAVQTGWGIDAARMQLRLNLVRPGAYPEVPQGGSIWVFAVD